MFVLITLVLFTLTTAAMMGLRLSRYSASYSWIIAALGALLAWVSILVWQIDLPRRFIPSLWAPNSLYNASPNLLADSYAWLYALSLAALAAAMILTSPARAGPGRAGPSLSPTTWAGTMALTALGLLAILADNPLTLVLGWTAIDLTEFFNTLRASDTPSLSERAVVSFTIRAAGTGFALWASVISALNGQAFLFENATTQTGVFLLLAVGLRLGVLPLHLTYRSEPMLRRGFGTVLRLLTAATSLILLARLPASAMDANTTPYLMGLIALAALYGAWNWLVASDELSGRPYWIIGMSALSLAAALRGNSTGSAAWGAALVLFGGISFLYSARNKWFTRVLAGLGILLLALPFSLTSTGWAGTFPLPLLFWPLFIAAHLMLVAGYVRHLFHPGETTYAEQPTWAQSAYPVGLALLVLTAILTGLWGWPGAMQLGVWIAGAALLGLGMLSGFAIWRFRRLTSVLRPPGLDNTAVNPNTAEAVTSSAPRISRLGDLLDLLTRVLWAIYRLLSSLFGLAANLLEGDGGLLWTLLLLVLYITFFRGR